MNLTYIRKLEILQIDKLLENSTFLIYLKTSWVLRIYEHLLIWEIIAKITGGNEINQKVKFPQEMESEGEEKVPIGKFEKY